MLLRRLLLSLSLGACLLVPAQAAELTLRYAQPAPDTPEGWEQQALPIGNGRLGAMLFGNLARERLPFNDITLWRGASHDSARDAAWMHDCFTPSPRRHH